MPPKIRVPVLAISVFFFLSGSCLGFVDPSSKIWHSYSFNEAEKPQEGIKLINITLSNFGTTKNIQKWKVLQNQKSVSVLGVRQNYLNLVSLDGEINFIVNKSDWTGYLADTAIFQTWNTQSKSTESFLIIVICENSKRSILKWYHIVDGNLVYLWDWPINRIISYINVISYHNELKLLIVNTSPSAEKFVFAEVYSFSVKGALDIWLYDKFTLDENPSTSHMSYCNNNIYVIFAFPKMEVLLIYKHHTRVIGHSHFRLHHKIESKNITGFTTFCFNFDCFVAIAGFNASIYKFNANVDLVHIGKINFGFVTKWLPVPLYRFEERIILLAQKERYIQLISLFGDLQLQIENELSRMACGQDSFCSGEYRGLSLHGATSFYYNKNHYILFTSTKGTGKLLRFIIETDFLQDVVDNQLKEILRLQSRLQVQWKEQGEKMKRLKKKLNIMSSEPEEIHPNSWKLKNILAESVVVMKEPNPTISYFEFGENKNWIDKDYPTYLSLISQGLLNELDERLKKIDSLFNDVERTATIDTSKLNGLSVDNAIFSGSVTVNELELSHLNGIDVHDLLNNSLMFGSSRRIGGTKVLTNIKVDKIYFEQLNGIPESHIMFSDQLQNYDNRNVINGAIVYENDITVLGKLELMRKMDFSLSTLNPYEKGFQYIDGVTFKHLSIMEELVVEKALNERPLILPLHSSPFEMFSSGNITQVRVEIVNVDNKVDLTFINDQKLDKLWNESNCCFERANFTENEELKNFTTSTVNISYLNNVKFPDGYITTNLRENVIIYGTKKFCGYLSLGNLFLQYKEEDSEKNPFLNSSIVVTAKNLQIKGIFITEKLNNITWNIPEDILRWENDSKSFLVKKRIRKSKFSKELISNTLNARGIDTMMSKLFKQELTTKIFNDLVLEHVTITGTLNKMNVQTVNEETVRLSENRAYKCNLIFGKKDYPHMRELSSCTRPGNFNIVNNELLIKNDMKLNEIYGSVLIVNGFFNSHDSINSVNLTEFNLSRLSVSQSQIIRGNFNPESVVVHALDFPVHNKMDYLNISSLHSRESSLHKLLRSKTYFFDSVFVRNNVKTINGINGFNVKFIDQNAISIKKLCSIKNKVIFKDKASFQCLKINGRLQGIHLKRFSQDLIFDSSHVFARSTKNFLNNITVTDKMKTRTLNKGLIQKLLTKAGDHSLKGLIIVNGSVTVAGNTTVYGFVNGSRMVDLLDKYSPTHESYIIKNDAVLYAEEISHLLVGGLIMNVPFKSFLMEVVKVKNDTNVTARKIVLGSVNFDKNVKIDDTMNGLNIPLFGNDIVLVNNDVNIKGDLIMRKTIMQNAVIQDDFNSSLIHGFDTSEWLEESILLNDNSYITGKKIFVNVEGYDDIETTYFNNFLFANVVLLKTEQLIICSCYLPRMVSASDLAVDGKVNDKVMDSEFLDTVLIDADQEIEESLIFMNDFIVQRNLIVHNSDRFNVITLHTDQTISSEIIFENTVIATSEIDNLKYIDDVDLKTWNETSISLNKNQVIQADWIFTGNVTFEKRITGCGLLNAESIPQIRKSIKKLQMLTKDIENKTISDYDAHCRKISHLSRKVKSQPTVLHHFEIFQVLKTSISVESVLTFWANDTEYLMVTFFDECRSILYQWNNLIGRFKFLHHLNIGPVNKWMTLNLDNLTYLITSSDSAVTCEKYSKPGNIWIFDSHKYKFVNLFTTDAFIDIIKSNRSDYIFYTLAFNGDIKEWNLQANTSNNFVANVGEGLRIFLEFDIFGELAVSDGNQVKNEKNIVIYTFAKSHNGKLFNSTVKGKKVIVVVYQDEIVLYENLLTNNIFLLIRTSNANSIVWLNSHSEQPYLIYNVKGKTLEIIHFKGGNKGFEKLSVPIPSQHLTVYARARSRGLRSTQFLTVIQKKKVLLLQVNIIGNLYEGNGFLCT